MNITSNGLNVNTTITGTANYTIKRKDFSNGSVINLANATCLYNQKLVSSNNTTVRVNATLTPALSITKSESPTNYSKVGQNITYTYNVTNIGNVTLSSVNVTDITWVSNIVGTLTLAPGASTNVTLTYNTTQADYNNGSVVDYAVANGAYNRTTVHATAEC